MEIIVPGHIEQESYYYRRFSGSDHTYAHDSCSIGEVYGNNHVLRSIEVGGLGEHCFYSKDMPYCTNLFICVLGKRSLLSLLIMAAFM